MGLAEIAAGIVVALLSGLCSGLVTWGAIRTELRWLRRDSDLAHERIDALEEAVHQRPAMHERRTSRVRNRTRGAGRGR